MILLPDVQTSEKLPVWFTQRVLDDVWNAEEANYFRSIAVFLEIFSQRYRPSENIGRSRHLKGKRFRIIQ